MICSALSAMPRAASARSTPTDSSRSSPRCSTCSTPQGSSITRPDLLAVHVGAASLAGISCHHAQRRAGNTRAPPPPWISITGADCATWTPPVRPTTRFGP